MQSIILIGDEQFTLEQIKSINHRGATRSYAVHEGKFCVEYGVEDIVFYTVAPETANEYEDGELDIVPFENPQIIMMSYKSEARMRQILSQDDFLRALKVIYVDDTHGVITQIEKYVEGER